jgi:hypothetical protein
LSFVGVIPETGAVTQVAAEPVLGWAWAGAPRARPPAMIPAARADPVSAVTMRRVMVVVISIPLLWVALPMGFPGW